MRPRTSLGRNGLLGVAAVVIFGGCPRGGTRGPAREQLAPWTLAVETTGVASADAVATVPDGRVAATFQASAAATLGGQELASPVGGGAVAMLAAGGAVTWTHALGGKPAGVAISGGLVVVGLGGTGSVDFAGAPVVLRGEPGAAVLALGAADGADRWARPIGSTEWVLIRALAAVGDDVIAVGSFAGTIRAGDRVVSSAGASDGFAVRIDGKGEVRWLIRIGGESGDAIAAVAPAPEGAMIGGTFTGPADARGAPLTPIDAESIAADGFVARLDDDGAVMWAQPFGGESDDAVAGVAVTASGAFAAAVTLRGTAFIDDKVVATRGLADAALLTFDGAGHRRAVALIGGDDFDSAAALAAIGDDLVIATAYAGRLFLGDTRLDGDGGDGALVAVLDASGEVIRVHDVAGPGRETIASLAASPSGWVAAVRHTAGATLDATALPAPADPYGGAALAFRGE